MGSFLRKFLVVEARTGTGNPFTWNILGHESIKILPSNCFRNSSLLSSTQNSHACGDVAALLLLPPPSSCHHPFWFNPPPPPLSQKINDSRVRTGERGKTGVGGGAAKRRRRRRRWWVVPFKRENMPMTATLYDFFLGGGPKHYFGQANNFFVAS